MGQSSLLFTGLGETSMTCWATRDFSLVLTGGFSALVGLGVGADTGYGMKQSAAQWPFLPHQKHALKPQWSFFPVEGIVSSLLPWGFGHHLGIWWDHLSCVACSWYSISSSSMFVANWYHAQKLPGTPWAGSCDTAPCSAPSRIGRRA